MNTVDDVVDGCEADKELDPHMDLQINPQMDPQLPEPESDDPHNEDIAYEDSDDYEDYSGEPLVVKPIIYTVLGPPEDVNLFRTDFELKYGSTHPEFFVGNYNEAIDAAKRDFRFLLVYIHWDSHEETEKFCQSVLINQKFIDCLTEYNIIFWSSDVIYPEGFVVRQQLEVTTYPFMALISMRKSQMVVVRRLEGITLLEPLIAQLRDGIVENRSALERAKHQKMIQQMNELLRQEQEGAYEVSLRVDREKERQRREERTRVEREEQEANERMQRLLQLKERLIREIPTEPQLNDTNATHVVIKLPNGRRLERRFLKTESMRSLYDFVFCNNDSPLNFIIHTNFPTRDLPGRSPQLEDFLVDDNVITRVDDNTQWTTLEESGVGHKEMLYIKELDN